MTHLRALPAPDWLNVDAAAVELGCSRRTVFRLIAAGELPSSRVGRTRRIRREHLDAYLDRRTTVR